MFTHLHVHTEFSLLDSTAKIKNIVSRVKELGMKACAITDHGVCYGLIEFYNECRKQGIKPILGCEVYEAPKSRFDKTSSVGNDRYYHLILLVKNEIGYKNLCYLVSRSNTEGYYYKPRIDKEILKEHHEGLICLAACIGGRPQNSIIRGDIEQAEKEILEYKELFGEDYYLEIQNHGIKEEMVVAQEFIKLGKKHDIKIVVTNDCHYVLPEDKEAHEWMLCMQTGKTLNSPDRMIYDGDYSIKSEDDMAALFPNIPEVITNTQEIVDKVVFEVKFANTPADYRMPRVDIPEEYENDYFSYLQNEAYIGFEKRYPLSTVNNREEIKARLEYELSVVKQMGFAEYFLDTRKTIMWAREHSILVGPGRGSGAGSVLNYCLYITDIDPIKYGLLFERFLNPERISMPDIDVDYCYAYKEDIVKSEADSNGMDKFCKIQTFVGMNAKGILKDCVRVADLPFSVGTEFSNLISDPTLGLEENYAMSTELQNYVNSSKDLKKVWEIALKLEGLKKTVSTHACGHIPTPVPCETLFPCSVDKAGYLVCQYDMVEAEHLGNLKKDLLMLRNLDIIDVARKSIKQRYGVDVPLWTEEILNDEAALALIRRGDTAGVFQLESEGMQAFMRDLKPTCFEDIIAGVSLYRPGPMDYIPDYVNGKHHPDTIKYDTPELKPILESTYGVIVYQEQVMQIVRDLGGFTMGRADLVRKAMGKKKMDIMEAEGKNFIFGNSELDIDGCVGKNISEETAKIIYDKMIDFAKYAFNKSHAASYAAISMQTAYLKAHYPVEFFAGLLSSVMDKPKKMLAYAATCIRAGYKILPPNVNTSVRNFLPVSDKEISFGLKALKGIGDKPIEIILKEREIQNFESLSDFIKRTELGKDCLEPLILAGGFDFTGFNRKSLINAYPAITAGSKSEKKKNIPGQLSLFDLGVINEFSDSIEELEEYDISEMLSYEKDYTNMYLSGHPLDNYMEIIEKCTNMVSDFLQEDEEEDNVQTGRPKNSFNKEFTVCGLCKNVRSFITKKGDYMSTFVLEDMSGEIKVCVFPKKYELYKNEVKENNILIIKGTLAEDGNAIFANEVTSTESLKKIIWLRFKTDKEYKDSYNSINELRSKNPGKDDVYVFIENTKQLKKEFAAIDVTKKVAKQCENLFKKENVIVKYELK